MPSAYSVPLLPLPHPVFLRREAVAADIDDRALHRLVRSGVLSRLRQGVYAESSWWEGAGPRAQHLALTSAVLRATSAPVALCHATAAAAHGLPLWDLELDSVHLLHLSPTSGRRLASVVHHRGATYVDDLTVRKGMLITDVARTIVDVVAASSTEHGVVLADHALHHGLTTHPHLFAQVERQRHDAGTLSARLVPWLADAAIESVGESRAKWMFWVRGFPAPQTQFPIRDRAGRILYRVDFAWPELGLIVEFDGLQKYDVLLQPGETARDVLVREKRREDRIRELTGFMVVRITWADLARPEATIARLWAAVAQHRAATA